MTNWVKLLIPLGLGIVAGGINFLVMYRSVDPHEFIVAREDLAAGEELSELNLVKKVVSGEAAALLKAAVPWEEHQSLVYGRRLMRPLEKDDLLLWRDVNTPEELVIEPEEDAMAISLEGVAIVERFLPIGDHVTFVVSTAPVLNAEPDPESDRFERVGPFRLLSVGPRMTKFSADNSNANLDSRVVTIAIPRGAKDVDAKARKLLNALAQGQHGGSPLIAMIVHGANESPVAQSPGTQADSQE